MRFFSLNHTFWLEIKKSIQLAIPLMVSQATYCVSFGISVWIAAQLGEKSLAAIALGNAIWVVIGMILVGFLSSVGVLVAQNFGANNALGIQSTVAQGVILSTFLALVAMVGLWFSPILIQHFGGDDPEIRHLSSLFLRAFTWTLVPFVFLCIAEQFLIGLQKTRLVFYLSLIQAPLEALGMYVFVFGAWGIPSYGVAGFGYGFTSSLLVTMGMLAFFLWSSSDCRKYRIFQGFSSIQWKVIAEIWRVGWPIAMMFAAECITLAIITFWMAKFGGTALAAYQLVRQYLVTALAIIFAVSEVTMSRVGFGVGQRDRSFIKRTAYANQWIGLIFMLIVAVIYIVFKLQLIGINIDIHDPENATLVKMTMNFMNFIAIYLVLDIFRIVGFSMLRGLKDTKFSLYGSMVGYWVITLPVAYVLAFPLHLGSSGLWLGLIIGAVAIGVIFIQRFRYQVERMELT